MSEKLTKVRNLIMDKMTAAADLVRRAYKNKTKMAALKAEHDGIVADLLALGWDSGKQTTSAGPFTVSAVNEYPQSAMRQNLLGGQARLCQKPVSLDPAKVKALFPAAYEAARVQKGQKVAF